MNNQDRNIDWDAHLNPPEEDEITYVTCEDCNGEGEVSTRCEECEGEGHLVCEFCNLGQVECDVCKGYGCVDCGDTGVIACEDCWLGFYDCFVCDRIGWIVEECLTCGGFGDVEEEH